MLYVYMVSDEGSSIVVSYAANLDIKGITVCLTEIT